jgi:hypothetical protein
MKIRHKLLQDFQFTSSDKKIFILKKGTIIDGFKYKIKDDTIDIDMDIVLSNPDYFETIDWRSELLIHLKASKVPQPSQISKKIVPFIEEMILSSSNSSNAQATPNVEVDDTLLRDLERRESDLIAREKKLTDKESKSVKSDKIKKLTDNSTLDELFGKKESNLRERELALETRRLEMKDWERELKKIQLEIENWEALHWKMKKNVKPPSAE